MSLQTPEIAAATPIGWSDSADAAHAAVTPQWLTTRRFSVMLLLLLVAAFPEVIFGAKTFFFRDYALFGYPLAHYHREAFWHGEIPLWNPLSNCGIPFLAQWNTMVFYPGSLIYLLLPMPWSLGWFCLFHLFLAGLGMHRLAFHWTENRLAAGIAGISFAFSGLTLSGLIWPNNIAALGWFPWVLLYVQKAWRHGGAESVKGVFIGAAQMLCGAPEVILFTWIIIAAVFICEFFAPPAARIVLLRRFVLICVLVGAVSAIQLLPFFDLLYHSHRGAPTHDAAWSMPPWGWANFLVPLFHMKPTSIGVFLQPGQGWTSSYYLGIGTVVLALVAIFKVRHRFVRMFATILLVSLVLALGEAGYLYGWLHAIFPQLGVMRFPVKLVIFAACVVPLLAGFAVAHGQGSTDQQKSAFWRVLLIVGVACLLLIGAILYFASAYPTRDEPARIVLMNGISRAAILLVILALFFALRQSMSFRARAGLELALLLAVWLDLISHVPNQNPTVEAQAYHMSLPPLTQMDPRPQPGESRAMLTFRALEKFHNSSVSNSLQAVLGVRLGLYDNCNLLEGIPKVDGFYSLYLPEQQEIRFNLFPSTNGIRSALADFLGASQVTSEQSLLEWQSRKDWMPLITTGQQPRFAGPEETLDQITHADFDPRKVVYLPMQARSFVSVSNSFPGKILAQTVSAHRVTADVEIPGPSMLVIAQTFYHPWKAAIDGKPAILWRANHAFQAVEVLAGRHRVELVYRDGSFCWGTAISGGTVSAFALVAFRCRKKRNSGHARASTANHDGQDQLR